MTEKQYKLSYLPTFVDDFNQAVDYIAGNLANPIAAENFINAVETAIFERQPYADCFQPYPSAHKKKYPYYYIPVGNYCVYYVLIDDVMEIRRLLYGHRNIENML